MPDPDDFAAAPWRHRPPLDLDAAHRHARFLDGLSSRDERASVVRELLSDPEELEIVADAAAVLEEVERAATDT